MRQARPNAAWLRGAHLQSLRVFCLAVAVVVVAGFIALPAGLRSRTSPAAASGVVAALSAGSGHTCALTTGGGAVCWGANRDGQLGDGEACGAVCTTPVGVSALGSGAVSVSAGDFHTCVVTTAGGVACWGRNGDGQLGDGTTTTRTSPVDVSGLTSGVAGVSAGDTHTCAVTSSGGVKCWGRNDDGQLGDGGTCGTVCTTPVDVAGLPDGVAAVSAGDHHTCALTTEGGVKCWGLNVYGALGDGTITARSTPVDVAGLAGIVAVSAGGWHTCALTTEGGVTCWGRNIYGALGDGATVSRSTPASVSGLTGGVAAISAGDYDTCALTTEGGVTCWGLRVYGPPGEGAFSIRTAPARVSGLAATITAISAGDYHNCALTAAGGVKCWGYNAYGQLGNDTITTRASPVDVVGLGAKPATTATLTPSMTALTPTATSTPTQTPGPQATETPTATPSEPPSPTTTPTATDTPTRVPHLKGDADGDGTIDSVDAALIIQYAAGLLPSISPSSDMNQDGQISAVDAALVLQQAAGVS